MLLDANAIAEGVEVLRGVGADAFYFPKHAELFTELMALWDQNRPIDGVLLADELSRKQRFEALGGYPFLAELIDSVPHALRVRHYGTIVWQKHMLRRLIGAAYEALEKAYEDREPAEQVLDFAEEVIFHVTEQRVRGESQLLPELVTEVFQQIQDRDGKSLTGVPTGYYELDEVTCGLQPAELIIVAARPSMGKTALGLNIAENMAINENLPVVFFSLEMSRQQVTQRILCSRARVDSHRLRRGRVSADEMRRLQSAADQMMGKPLLVDDTSSLSIMELRARARMAYRKYGIRAVFVDYLQLMRAPGAESRQMEVTEISRGLKALAKELALPVVAMAQLNRNPEERSSNRPRMSDLRESGAIEQDADVIALLHRESYYKQAETDEDDAAAQLIIAKQRNGPVCDIELHFNKSLTRFDNPESGHHYDRVPEANLPPGPYNADGPGLSEDVPF